MSSDMNHPLSMASGLYTFPQIFTWSHDLKYHVHVSDFQVFIASPDLSFLSAYLRWPHGAEETISRLTHLQANLVLTSVAPDPIAQGRHLELIIKS